MFSILNYFNVLPISVLVIIVLFFILGLIFYVVLFPYAESAITNELILYGNNANKIIFKENILFPNLPINLQSIINNYLLNLKKDLKEIISSPISNEKSDIESNNIKSIVTFTFTLVGLIILLLSYFYVMKYVLYHNVNWIETIITFSIIIFLIIIFLLLFLFTMIIKRELNKDKVLNIALEYFFT